MGKVEPEEVVAAMHRHDDPVVTAQELAEDLPSTARTVTNKLRELAAAGEVARKEVGARAVVYWLPGTRKPRPDAKPRERSLAADQADLREATVEASTPIGERVGAGGQYGDPVDEDDRPVPDDVGDPDELPPEVEDAVAALELPGRGERVEQRREAVRACLRQLRSDGEGRKSTWTTEVYPEHPAGYESEGGWWNTVGKSGLQELAGEVEAVDAPGEGSHVWYWRE